MKGLSIKSEQVERSIKNKAMGAYYLAHEFGHTYYRIPDQYEHGGACLMNSAYEDMAVLVGYKKLIESDKACQQCEPWVTLKHEIEELKSIFKSSEADLSHVERMLTLIAESPTFILGRDYFLSLALNFPFRYYESIGDELGLFYCVALAKNNRMSHFLEWHVDKIKKIEKE